MCLPSIGGGAAKAQPVRRTIKTLPVLKVKKLGIYHVVKYNWNPPSPMVNFAYDIDAARRCTAAA